MITANGKIACDACGRAGVYLVPHDSALLCGPCKDDVEPGRARAAELPEADSFLRLFNYSSPRSP
jgi:hypothetical protein